MELGKKGGVEAHLADVSFDGGDRAGLTLSKLFQLLTRERKKGRKIKIERRDTDRRNINETIKADLPTGPSTPTAV